MTQSAIHDVKRLPSRISDFWSVPALIQRNNFVYKSLSEWSFNVSVGCTHACRFCYVPSVSTIKQGARLSEYGITDPDEEWGNYVLVRPWDENRFGASLRAAENTPMEELKRDGNRAVMFCTTTDPYQTVTHADAAFRRQLQDRMRFVVRQALIRIRDESTLNVRILTRSPLAKVDFDLFASFGKRLLFGMSLPTLRNDLAKVYEPRAPSPTQRLATLKAAKDAGLNIYVAIAPSYPESDQDDLRETLSAVAKLHPTTVFHEPINIRAENVSRIVASAKKIGLRARSGVFESRENWRAYALESLQTVEKLANELGMHQLHLWPDKSLGTISAVRNASDPARYQAWLERWWNRVSEWPQ